MSTSTSNLTLSVGIPTFNQADFLAQTLDSLLDQTRPPDEILVSDHYSTDNTQEVLSRYAGPHPRRPAPPGVNLTGQYNFTLSSMTGDWITLLSSDDIARPTFCETLTPRRRQPPRRRPRPRRLGEHRPRRQVVSQPLHAQRPQSRSPPATSPPRSTAPRSASPPSPSAARPTSSPAPSSPRIESLADWALFLQIAPFGSYIYEHDIVSGYRVGHDGNKFRERLASGPATSSASSTKSCPSPPNAAASQTSPGSAKPAATTTSATSPPPAASFPPAEARIPVVALFQPWADSLATQLPTPPGRPARLRRRRDHPNLAALHPPPAKVCCVRSYQKLPLPPAPQLTAQNSNPINSC